MEVPPVRYAKTRDGVHIAYQVYGDGPLDMVLSTGLWWHLEFQWTEPSFVRFKERLSRVARVIEFDKRGTGLSDRVPVDRLPTLEERIDDITAVLDAVESTSAVLYGVNHGAPLMIMFAATFPERTSALILLDGYARWLAAVDYPSGFPPALAERVEERMLEHWDEPHALGQIAPSRAQDPYAQDWWVRMQRLAVSPAAAVALWRMTMDTDVRDLLPAIHVPTLLMHRTDGRLVNVECGRHLAQHIDGVRFVEFPGADLFFVDLSDLADVVEEFVTGKPPQPESDRVLVTVMFTDIVESTTMLAEVGDRQWHNLLDRHDEVVDRALERYRGRKVNPTGDGVLAIFDGPVRAVQCGCAIRDGVAGLGLDVRVGLHTGEVELRGNDVAGVNVHIAARIAALANAGDVLVTRTLTDLVAGSRLRFSDRGEHALKGVPRTWHVYAVNPTP